jgi:hypothetical protein
MIGLKRGAGHLDTALSPKWVLGGTGRSVPFFGVPGRIGVSSKKAMPVFYRMNFITSHFVK